MDNNAYISVSKFSKKAGISKQAVYSQLNKKLKPYLKMLNGKKMIDISALELYNNTENSQDFKLNINQELQDFKSSVNQDFQPIQTTIETLREQLAEKDKQLAEKDKQIIELTETIKIQAQSINAANHAELADRLKIESAEVRESREQQGFFKRLFSKK